MGWLGKLFGKSGPRKPPAWARDAFGTNGARFDAFVSVVLEVLAEAGHRVSEMDVRTGGVLLGEREWVFEDVGRQCASADPARWRGLVEHSLNPQAGRREDDEDDEDKVDDDEAPSPPRDGGNAWMIGAAPWGVVFECGTMAMVLVVFPTVDPVALLST
jgi:hypothetical protein